jgi:hypothetical protein
MQFQVSDIRFDFIVDDDQLSPEEQLEIIETTCGQIWEAEDDDDLVEEITCATGWCVTHIEYNHALR